MSQEVRYTSSHPRQGFVPRLFPSAEKRSLLLYLIVCAVGITLGVATAIAASLTIEWVVVLIIAVMGTALIAVFGNIERLLLAAAMMHIPLQLDAFIGYQEEVSARGAISGWIVSLATIALVGLYVLWLLDLATTRKKDRSQVSISKRFILLPLLYVGFNVLSLAVAQNLLLSSYGLFQMVQLLLLFVYIAFRIRSEEDVLFLVTMLLVGLILESLIMIFVRVTGTTYDLGFTTASLERSGRVNGTMGSPNAAGGYLSMTLAVAVGALMVKDKPMLKWLAIVAISLGMISLILTFSRGAWLGFAVACMVIGFVSLRKGWLTPSVIFAAFVVLVLLIAMNEGISARVLGNDAGAAESRVYLNELAFNMIKAHPLLGVGINNFTVAMYDYQTVELANIWLFAVHNKYLLVWSEAGIGALITYMLFLLLSVRRGWRDIFKEPHPLSPIVLGLIAGILAHMTHMFVDVFNRGAALYLVWLYTALIVAIGYCMQQYTNEGATPEPAEG